MKEPSASAAQSREQRQLMASNRTKLRRGLFRLYAANLALLVTDGGGGFVCPICETGYYEPAVEPATLAVDIAHVFPEACGGNPPVTLTCKRCNSRMGAKYDSHIARDFRLVDALDGSGRGSLKTRLKFSSGSMGAEVRRTGDHYHFEPIAKQTNPAELDRIFGSMVGGGDIAFQMDFQVPDNRRLPVAMLHSAYLCLFRYFGYEYCLLGNSQWIRDLLNQDDPPQEAPILSMDMQAGRIELPPHIMFSPLVARTAQGHKLLAVPLPTPTPSTIARTILLPGFDPGADESYRNLRTEWVGKEQQLRLATDLHRPEERLAEPRFATYGLHWWKYLCSKLDRECAEKEEPPSGG